MKKQPLIYVLAAILAVIGIVWILQGLSILKGGSFMVGQSLWAIIGAAVLALALGMVWWGNRRPR